jgi:small-conductance mechanosensitive channel
MQVKLRVLLGCFFCNTVLKHGICARSDSTWVRMLPNNRVILPNSVMAQSKIINYFYPEQELSVLVGDALQI